MKRLRILLLIPVILLGSILAIRFFVFLPASVDTATTELNIPPGASVSEIADSLKKEGFVRCSFLFQLYAYAKRAHGNLQAGTYYLPKNLTIPKLVDELQHGVRDVRLTFIEGWRREEYGKYIKDQRSKIKDKNLDEDFFRLTEDLEGYLFPDTYFVDLNVTAEELVKKLKDNFEEKFDQNLREQAEKSGLSKEEVVILASIVEREAKYEEDRPIVAGILIKRYQEGMALEADATVQYAKANKLATSGYFGDEFEWWPKVSEEDLKFDSLYNTRLISGLPPTPICNPGLSSIRAVVYPKGTDHWYYVSDQEGRMHYASSLEEHNVNVSRYLSR